MKRIIYLILAISLGMGGCKKKNEEEKTGSIHGIVSEKKTGNPVNAARVEVGTTYRFSLVDDSPDYPEKISSTVTGNDGYYEFNNLQTEISSEHDYYIKVSKENYQDQYYIKFKIESGKAIKGDIFLIKNSKIFGVVTREGSPISGVEVVLLHHYKGHKIQEQTIQTNTEGYYEFKTVSGTHQLMFYKPGTNSNNHSATATFTLNIANGDDYERNFEFQ